MVFSYSGLVFRSNFLIMYQTLLRTLFFLFLIFAYCLSSAQSSQKDSLFKILQSPAVDTSKVGALINYGEIFELSNPDSAVYYYEKARQLAEEINYTSGIATYISYYIVILNNQGKYKEALNLCKQAINIQEERNDRKGMAIAYINVASEYQYLGYYKLAADYYIKAILLAEEINDLNRLSLIHNNIAGVMLLMKDYEKGYKYALKGLKMAHTISNPYREASALVNLCWAHFYMNQFDSLENYLPKVLEAGKSLDDYTYMLDHHLINGELALKKMRIKNAITSFEAMYMLARNEANPSYEFIADQKLAEAYFASAQYDLAASHIHKAISIAEAIEARSELADLYRLASQINEKGGKWRDALNHLNKYIVLNDSLQTAQTQFQIQELETQFQTAQKDKTLAENQLQLEIHRENIRKKNALLIASVAGIAVLSVIVFLVYRSYRQKQKLHAQTLFAMEKEREVVRLKATLEGQEQERQRISKEMHDDIGSGLTTILFMSENLRYSKDASSNNGIKISETANGLIDKMNEIIWSMNTDYNTLEDLVAYLRSNISELLSNVNLDYRFSIPDEIPSVALKGVERRNVYLVVKESLHNIIKHAHASFVTIEITFHNGLTINIRDNGVGVEKHKTRRFGNGLRNMQERMENIGGAWKMVTEENGTSVHINLPT